MIIDSHAHLNFKAFNKDLKEIVQKCLDNDVWVVNVGSQYETSFKAVEIAEQYPQGMYASVGLHPLHSDEDFSYEKYQELASFSKVVAIGETGLDYFRGPDKEKQKQVFLSQMKLAQELKKPVILHCRMAHNDLLEMLSGFDNRGVIHCFSGTWLEAQRYLDLGFFIGFTGIIFKLDLKETIMKAPLEKILVETDSPYLSSHDERNEPLFVREVAKEIARIRKIDYQEVEEKTFINTKNLFQI